MAAKPKREIVPDLTGGDKLGHLVLSATQAPKRLTFMLHFLPVHTAFRFLIIPGKWDIYVKIFKLRPKHMGATYGSNGQKVCRIC